MLKIAQSIYTSEEDRNLVFLRLYNSLPREAQYASPNNRYFFLRFQESYCLYVAIRPMQGLTGPTPKQKIKKFFILMRTSEDSNTLVF